MHCEPWLQISIINPFLWNMTSGAKLVVSPRGSACLHSVLFQVNTALCCMGFFRLARLPHNSGVFYLPQSHLDLWKELKHPVPLPRIFHTSTPKRAQKAVPFSMWDPNSVRQVHYPRPRYMKWFLGSFPPLRIPVSTYWIFFYVNRHTQFNCMYH